MSKASLGQRVSRMRGEVRRREIERVLSLWRKAEGSQHRFCNEQGISTQTLSRWRKELGDLASAAPPRAPAFIEVSAPHSEAHSDALYEIVLPSGTSVRVPPGFDETELARLLSIASAC